MSEANETQVIEALAKKIDALIKIIVRLHDQNMALSEEFKKNQSEHQNYNYLLQITELEAEISLLKKENKRLKEKEKLVKNKMERLAIKLEQVKI